MSTPVVSYEWREAEVGQIYFFKAHMNNLSFGKYFMTVCMCVISLCLLGSCCDEFAFSEALVNAEEQPKIKLLLRLINTQH